MAEPVAAVAADDLDESNDGKYDNVPSVTNDIFVLIAPSGHSTSNNIAFPLDIKFFIVVIIGTFDFLSVNIFRRR